MRESWVASHGVEARNGEVLSVFIPRGSFKGDTFAAYTREEWDENVSPTEVRVKFSVGEVTIDGRPARAHWSNN